MGAHSIAGNGGMQMRVARLTIEDAPDTEQEDVTLEERPVGGLRHQPASKEAGTNNVPRNCS